MAQKPVLPCRHGWLSHLGSLSRRRTSQASRNAVPSRGSRKRYCSSFDGSSTVPWGKTSNSVAVAAAQAACRRVDPGDWTRSAEWWGTQGGGWGRNEGITVFNRPSQKGNGEVSVTAHPASIKDLEDWPELAMDLQRRKRNLSTNTGWEVLGSDWRVLRFNNVTRQSVAKVYTFRQPHDNSQFLLQIPDCLAFEYLKSMMSTALASISCAGLDLELVLKGEKRLCALCIGLGGGSLPLFLANKVQGCFVEAVEIDKTVISAATEFMGFPASTFNSSEQSASNLNTKALETSLWGGLEKRIAGFEADGVSYVCDVLKKVQIMGSCMHYYDLVFVDAFDGQDEVPFCLWNHHGPFLSALTQLLHPIHGTVVMNLHTDKPPPTLLERITGDFGPGFDPRLPGGKKILNIARSYRDKLLFASTENPGVAFTVGVPRQQNLCLVVSRGIEGTTTSVVSNLIEKANWLGSKLKVPFDMSRRVSRGFTFVT